MYRFTRAAFVCMLVAGVGDRARADEQEAKAVVDRAIKAAGGEEKLSAIRGFHLTGKGTITIEGTDIDFTCDLTVQGTGQYRSTYEGEVGGTKFAGATVVDGEKAWKKSDQDVKKLEGEELVNEKREAYLSAITTLLVPLKGKGFKLDSAPDEKVDGKPAAVVRVTGPEGKDVTLSFDKESGLPVKMSGQFADDQGQVDLQESTLEDYKEFEGIKVATRSRIKRSGKRFVEIETLTFKTVADADPATFAEPK